MRFTRSVSLTANVPVIVPLVNEFGGTNPIRTGPALPNPVPEQGGVSCPDESTAPSVCAETLPTKSRATAMLAKTARRVISPPVVGEILPLLQIQRCKFCVTLEK